ncbi:hypothetical protein BDF22DRAFT_174487 [Syncephalis plumigaleata]|nr:hypothetical protein BDF22DRAFT_174487 [Syncephalis plumigaleata]
MDSTLPASNDVAIAVNTANNHYREHTPHSNGDSTSTSSSNGNTGNSSAASTATQSVLSVATDNQSSQGNTSPKSPKEFQPPKYTIGVCAMHKKARSKPMLSILTRLCNTKHFDVIYFEESTILNDDVDTWPRCDFLIAFYSEGFPLEKAITYAERYQPYCVNDLRLQQALLDRRLVLRILDANGIPTPPRISVTRDQGPTATTELAERLRRRYGVELCGQKASLPQHCVKSFDIDAENKDVIPSTASNISGFAQLDDDTIVNDGHVMQKPFVEKPVNGDDHNVRIYYSSKEGGGARCLFRKVANKSSEFCPDIKEVRTDGSYIYEKFMRVNKAEDVKVYTAGVSYAHAETRKSPVVDGKVVRNPDGKEIRHTTPLTPTEKEIARKVCRAFGQTICGFDMLRVGDQSFVIDVNGWSFVKGNEAYYDRCASILQQMFLRAAHQRRYSLSLPKGTGLDNL